GLTFTPPAGLPGSYSLSVQAISTQTLNGDTATARATLPVTVNTVTPTALGLSGFVVNKGQAQRSRVQWLQVKFSEDVVISDTPNDVILSTKTDSKTPIHVAPSRYSYDPTTFTLTVNVDGLVMQDGEYLLQIRADGVASKANQAVTLSAGAA